MEDCSAVAFPAMWFGLDVEGSPRHLDSIRPRQTHGRYLGQAGVLFFDEGNDQKC